MNRSHRIASLFAGAAVFAGALGTQAAPAPAPVPAARRAVDLVVCLDTSGSMSGLIDAARRSIWAIVNDLALAKPAPNLRLALLTFGNDGSPAATGWVELQTGFTEDLDLVSQKLFALGTNGGTELVGRVLQAALDQLPWTEDPAALKLIVVAGNESADQDREVDFRDMCKRAASRGILVNSIYCGNPGDNIAPLWREVATRADGQFHAIDHNQQAVAIATPFDRQLEALSVKLNDTYLPYGEAGKKGWVNQGAQDRNASGLGRVVAAERAACKASLNYKNGGWDLVDACRDKLVELDKVPVKDLPEAMQKMSVEERRAYIERMQKERAATQKEIQELSQKREGHIAEERKKQALDPSKSFDFAVRKAVRDQARSKGMQIEEPATAKPASGETTGKK